MNSINHRFTKPLLKWFDKAGRKNLPWQLPRTPYRVWLSEIMLQQTQVITVIDYFIRFINRFPDINALANAHEEEVLALWSGLGYYSRARNLFKTALIIKYKYQGEFPKAVDLLNQLPGIGRSTAAAISAQAYNQPNAILDANVRRVLSRYYAVENHLSSSQMDKKLWQLADLSMDKKRCIDYTQAIMDLGALCCTNKNPKCFECPVNQSCQAYLLNKVHEYPIKKVKKIKPKQVKQFLLLFNALGQIYLEKRPPVGIWGSLWSLPMIESEENIFAYLNKMYGLDVTHLTNLPPMNHSFSHFHLEIHPRFLLVRPLQNTTIKELSGTWLELLDLTNIGLPKPVSKLIALGQEQLLVTY